MAVLLFKRSFNAERENETYETHSFNMIPFGEIDSTMNSFPLFTISMMSPTDMSSIGCIFIAQCTESFCVVVLCMGENFKAVVFDRLLYYYLNFYKASALAPHLGPNILSNLAAAISACFSVGYTWFLIALRPSFLITVTVYILVVVVVITDVNI